MPEFYIRQDQLDTFFRTEALEKPPHVFRKVHTPIDRIAVDFYREGSYQPFVSEEQVAKWVLSSSGKLWGNRIFTITGETGSGKSEICQAIRYHAEDSTGHVPILISRSMTRLRDIVHLLHKHLGQTEPEDIGEITAMPEETVRSAAVTECLLAVESKAFQSYTVEQRQKLRQILQDVAFGRLIERAFSQYKKEVMAQGKERVLELMDYSEFVNLMSGAAPWLKTAEVFPLLRSRINDGMKRLVSLGDLGPRLRAIAKYYQSQSKRPVLIMEDLTSFGFVKEDLLDYIFDLNAGNFDVVIGWTTGFEAEQLLNNPNEGVRSYMMDRMKGRFLTTSQDTRGSYFLEQNHLPMIRRYIDAVRLPDVTEKLPDPYFPLNTFAITRIYNHLIDDKGQQKRTPRLLIDVIARILRSNVNPWQEIEERLLGLNLQDWPLDDRFFSLKMTYPDAVAILKWYGRPEDFKVDRRLVELLGVQWPSELGSYLSDSPLSSESTAQRTSDPTAVAEDQRTYATDTTEKPDPQEDQSVKSGHEQTPKPAQTQTHHLAPAPAPAPAAPPAVDQELLELQHWVERRDVFPGRQKLKNGLSYLLGVLEGHASIANPRGQLTVLKYEKTTVPIVMAGTNDTTVDFPAILLQPIPDHYDFFRACLKITNRDQAEAAVAANLRLAAWAGSLVQDYQQKQREYLTNRLGMPIEMAVFHAYRIVKGMSDGVIDPGQPAFLETKLQSNPLLAKTGGLNQLVQLGHLMRLRHTIANLFQSFFFVNNTTADIVALERVAAGYSFSRAVGALNGFNKPIDVGFKVTVAPADGSFPQGKALHEVMILLRQAGGELLNADKHLAPERKPFGEFEEIISYADDMTVPLLTTQINSLKKLATRHNILARKDWQELNSVDSTLDFNGLHSHAQGALNSIASLRNSFQVVQAHRTVTELERLPAYRTLKLVREMLIEVESALRELTRRTLNQQQQFAQQDRDDCEDSFNSLSEALEG